MALPGSYNLKWHGHGVHLNSSISGLYSSDAFTDVVLATTDGRCSSAHQFVLSACSPYLHKMFLVGSNSLKSSAKLVIVLPSEISQTTLSTLLQYIYRGEAIVNHEQLPSIMRAAELLQIRGLCPGKDKRDTRSSSKSVLKQQNKNNTELQNNSETIKHRDLIPEVKYNSEPVSESVNSVNSVNKSSKSTTNTVSRSTPLKNASPDRKKHKGNLDKALLENKRDICLNSVEDSMIEKMIVAEEIQVKEEPIDWEEQKGTDENGSIVKQEVISEEEVEVEIEEEKCYVPLTCDLCQETFTTPALWVRHIEQNHPTTALASGKRGSVDDGTGEYPPLHCELCQQVFSVPAEWVRHIQTHTEQQLAQGNDTTDSLAQSGRGRVECTVCGKVLQSQASMQIHARTHTGERPYLCKLCGREFNVKSNYLRHLRTLHDQLVNSTSVE